MVSLMDLPTEIKKVLRQVGWLDDLLSMLEGDTNIDFSTGLMPFDFYFNGDEIIFEFSGDDERVTQSDLAEAIANIDLFEVVASLPTSNILKNRLYLVPNQEQESQNLYDVYLRVGNSWEKVDVTINLSGYVTTSALNTALNGKVDKVTGKGLSTNDFNNTYKSKLDNLEGTYATQDGVTADLSDYVKTDDSRLTNARTPLSHTHGNLQNTGQVGSTAQPNKNVVTDSNGKITTEDKPTIPSGSSTASDIKMNGTQSAGSSSKFAKADHIHPTDTSRAAASHTHTKEEITNFPSTMTPASHTHGNVSNDGKVGSSANKPLITGSNGVIQAGSFGNAANTFCEGNDPRLSDSRTPTSHNQDASTITISDTFSMFGTCSSQRVLNGVINEAFEALQILLGNVGSSDNVPFTSAILQNESVLVFTAIGNIVFVEYSLKGSSNSATDELLVTNYLPAIYRPENCTKYFDLAPHRNDATGVRLNITPQGHVGVTPLTANPIASYGSFFYLRQTTTYNGGV